MSHETIQKIKVASFFGHSMRVKLGLLSVNCSRWLILLQHYVVKCKSRTLAVRWVA